MVFQRSVFILLLQYIVIESGQAFVGHCYPPHHSLETDRAALLAFKRAIISDPKSTLFNWNDSTPVCNFSGVFCDKRYHRVERLIVNRSGLVGLLSPFLSNLTGLHVLQLDNNNLYGVIPSEFSSLRHLRHIELDVNNLHGPIPESFSLLTNLTTVTFRHNKLNGTLPASFFFNCTLLTNVDFAENSLTGQIPVEIGNCPSIWNLNLYSNMLKGELPLSLVNASNMYNLDVENNYLSGELPSQIVEKMPLLIFLHLSYNNMTSHDGNTNLETFFISLTNCTVLQEIELAGMNLGGRLPSSISRLSVNLESLLLQENQIFGSIPPVLANLSNLSTVNLSSNRLKGTIPEEIHLLSKMEQLFLSHNDFSGPIPKAFGKVANLGLLDLSNNQFSGDIPQSLGNLTRMISLFLNNNLLSGSIPASLGNLTRLYHLDLSYNRLTGSIPREILGLLEIRMFLNLSHNQLKGTIPIELSKLENVQAIDLSSNNITGNIFTQISNCISLASLNISHNALEGQLPDSFNNLKNLESLDVSRNHLSGKIPTSLSKIPTLTFLDLSFNNFEGKVPTGGIFNSLTNLSLLENPHLCGSIPGIPSCSTKHHGFHSRMVVIIFTVVISVAAFLTTICCAIGFRHIRGMIASGKTETERRKPAPELMHNFPRITYKELSDATRGFDPQKLIGTGSYGKVYKGVLSDGAPIAVKVLHLQSGNSTKSFNRECQVLKRIRHRNLIRIITACSLPDFKALVLPYMANGSLESRLYPHSTTGLGSGSSDLSLIQRVNICSDIAEGMAYLHHHSPVKVIHCDLKPSNVLLNDEMTALVSDFGIARLIMTTGVANVGVVENMGNSTANLLCGSIGYIAPEYGFGSNTSTKGDVYSFGILVLEMVSRKRPTDDMFVGGLSLHKWVKSLYHGRMEKVIESSLLRDLREQSPEVKKMWEVAISELIELGILCTQESPSTRPTMLDAADDLDRLKRYLSGDTTATFASSLGISSSNLGDD